MSAAYLPTVPMSPPPAPGEPTGPARAGPPTTIGGTEVGRLTPSLLSDLTRFGADADAGRLGWLEVMAAAVRHTQPVLIELSRAGVPAPAARLAFELHPHERVVHGALPDDGWLDGDLSAWVPTHIAPARRAAGTAASAWPARRASGDDAVAPLGPLLWAVALRGARATLLPELGGLRAYRVPPSASFEGLDADATTARTIERLRRETCNFAELADLHGLGSERAARLLNALYLQSALIVGRTHPAATNDGWSGYAPGLRERR